MANIDRTKDIQVVEHWSRDWAPLKDYMKAKEIICILPEWQASTMLLRQIRDAQRLFKDDLDRIKKAGDKAFDR